ncbi:hypothetical protein GH714_039989 [Hevea brasiliensis]|uniref:Uncharacterized protein n=1 Tax=Hevea brasiliensis TaxID=3981 RepID=A0A6A6M6Z7_HEVBR|nr:hypothetical protein GH714_039989 [Hevea brasiliensis]
MRQHLRDLHAVGMFAKFQGIRPILSLHLHSAGYIDPDALAFFSPAKQLESEKGQWKTDPPFGPMMFGKFYGILLGQALAMATGSGLILESISH